MDQIIVETMRSYNEYLSKLPQGCLKISEDIRQDNLASALKSILQFSEGVSWLIEVNALLEKNSIVNPIISEQINEFLNEINNGLEIQDYILVADMFEYEIKPFFEQCNFYEVDQVR